MSPSLSVYQVSLFTSVWCLLVFEHEYYDSCVCTCVLCLLVVVLVYHVSVYVHVYHVSVYLRLRLVKHNQFVRAGAGVKKSVSIVSEMLKTAKTMDEKCKGLRQGRRGVVWFLESLIYAHAPKSPPL